MASSRLVLLCHSPSWDRLYQAMSAMVTAASLERPVDAVFFFGALDKLVSGRLDAVELSPPDPAEAARLSERMEEIGTPPLSQMLAQARRSPDVRIFACSASLALMGHDAAEADEHFDEVIGWPTVLRLVDAAQHVIYL